MPLADFQSGSIFSIDFGPGLEGYLKQVYVGNHLEHNSVFQLFRDSFSGPRYFWFDTGYHSDPHYFKTGWGNGYVLPSETSEQWDDANAIDTDGWLTTCLRQSLYKWAHWEGVAGSDRCYLACGDSIYDPAYGEGWDYGNPSSNDSCTSAWTVVQGWDCSSSINGQPSTWVAVWGDGFRVSTEVCDDGNRLDNKGWKSNCSGSINGWHCTGGSPSSKDTWTEQCNDGYITISEQCEDGNINNGDGWSSSCQIETGWSWINNPAMTSSVWNTVWGDGILVIGHELWDDGNASDNQGCKPDWRGILNGWHCTGGSLTTSSIWSEQCGNGYVTTHEQWDDGNNFNSDGWSSNWLIENGWKWAQDSTLTRSYWTLWRNGVLDKGEEWDDGNKIDNDGWSSLCKYEACNSKSSTWKLTPTKTETIVGTSIQSSICAALILNIASSMLFGSSLNDFWWFLNVLQILHYLPMFTLYFPLNVFKMFSFIGIVNFENQYFSEVYLYHINQKDLSFKNSLNYRVENQGYDSTSILINCSDLFFSFILLIIYYLWITIVSLVLRPPYDSTDKNIWKSIYNKLHKSVKYKKSNFFLTRLSEFSLRSSWICCFDEVWICMIWHSETLLIFTHHLLRFSVHEFS